MKFRNLRIAWSVGWGVLAVLLCVLWVRSYWRFDQMRIDCPFIWVYDFLTTINHSDSTTFKDRRTFNPTDFSERRKPTHSDTAG